MNNKEQTVWDRAYNQAMDRGASSLDAYQTADCHVAGLAEELGSRKPDSKKAETETPDVYAERVMNVLKQCVRASLADVRNGADSALVAMLCFAAQRKQEPPTAQAQHHHVRCEITKIPKDMIVGLGNTFTWKAYNPTQVIAPSWNGVTTNVVPSTEHSNGCSQFDAIVYGPCPSIGAVITFDAPAITMNGDDVVVSQVFARVVSVIA